MSLLALLNLPAAAVTAMADPTPPGATGAAKGSKGKTSRAGKAARANAAVARPADTAVAFDDAEAGTVSGGDPQGRRIEMGHVAWDQGRTRQAVYGFAGEGGDLASGGAWPENELAQLNGFARRAIDLVAGLERREGQFREALRKVEAGEKEGEAILVALDSQRGAVQKRMDDTRDNFYDSVANFTDRIDKARHLAKEVEGAAATLAARVAGLEKAVAESGLYKARQQVATTQKHIADTEADIAQSKAYFDKALEIAGHVARQEWGKLADMAIGFAQENLKEEATAALVTHRLVDKLGTLRKALGDAKRKVDSLENTALAAGVKAAEADLSAAVSELQNAHDKLASALAQLPGAQRHAINELDTKGTRAIADMLNARARQVGTVAEAKRAGLEYRNVVGTVSARMAQFIEIFRGAPAFLDRAAQVKPYFRDFMPYGLVLREAASLNASTFDTWLKRLGAVDAEVEEKLQWLALEAEGGPLAHYAAALQKTQRQMG